VLHRFSYATEVHNLFQPMANNQLLKPFVGRTSATTQRMFDESIP